MHVLLEGKPRLVALLKHYIPAALFGYFGLIILANFLQLSGLAYWFWIWSSPIDLMREILPIFDNVESRLVAMRLAHRIGLIHHLILAGWSIFAVAFFLCTAAVLKTSRVEWVKVARARSAAKFAMWSVTMLLLFSLGLLYVSIGITQTGNVLYDWYRHDPPLLWIAGAFYVALATWVGALATFIAAIFAYRARRAQ